MSSRSTDDVPVKGDAVDVCFSVEEGIGRIVLNRPRAINALTHDMCLAIERQLRAWITSGEVTSIELSGSGERGLCSGADVRALREHVLSDPPRAVDFFVDEYRLDALIANCPIPFTALMRGICMGGGLGLSLHASRRVGHADTRLAMPETTIGLFPDVGSCFHLARCPGEVGAHLAMSGDAIDPASALWAGLIDEIVDADPDSDASALATDAPWIDECYVGDSASAIIARLEAHPDSRAREAGALIRTKSPWSVCVALEAVRRAAHLPTIDDVLAQDEVLARNFVSDSDFVEGVRAQLVDKDRQPRWRHARIEDVPSVLVGSMFIDRSAL